MHNNLNYLLPGRLHVTAHVSPKGLIVVTLAEGEHAIRLPESAVLGLIEQLKIAIELGRKHPGYQPDTSSVSISKHK